MLYGFPLAQLNKEKFSTYLLRSYDFQTKELKWTVGLGKQVYTIYKGYEKARDCGNNQPTIEKIRKYGDLITNPRYYLITKGKAVLSQYNVLLPAHECINEDNSSNNSILYPTACYLQC